MGAGPAWEVFTGLVLICFIHCLNRGAVGQPTQGCGDLVWGLFGDLEGLGGDQGKGWICLIL